MRLRFSFCLLLTIVAAMLSVIVNAQVIVTASAGTLGPTTYTTLKASFDAINLGTHQGVINVSITANTTETATATLNASGNGTAIYTSVVIKPASATTPTISGSIANNPIIKLNGANNVTIDGSNNGTTSKDLSITNTSTTASNIMWIGSVGTTAVHHDIIKNCNLTNGVNTSTGIFVGDAGTFGNAGLFNNITFQNNAVMKAYIGMYMTATPATGNGNNTLIDGNSINATGTNAIRNLGIYVQGVDGATVSNNVLGNFTANNAEFDRAIWIATSTVNSSVTGNTISTLAYTGTSSFAPVGISLSSGVTNANIIVSGNTISGITSSGTSNSVGILLYSAISNVSIFSNKIYTIKNTNTGDFGATGIELAVTGTTAATKVFNNFVSDIAGVGFNGYDINDNGNGIVVDGGGGYDIDFNTVAMTQSTTLGTAAHKSSAMLITANVSGTGLINLRNNIFVNLMTTGNANSRIALSNLAGSGIFSNINYNDYYSTSNNLSGTGTNASFTATIGALQTSMGGNANSVNILPVFTSTTDLHLPYASNTTLNNLGSPLPGITNDIDGDIRSTTIPDMGADEIQCLPVTITQQPIANIKCVGDSAVLIVNATNGNVYQWQQNTGAGFSNLLNNNPYNGANNDTLIIYNVPTSLNGSSYQCVVSYDPGCPTTTTSVVTLTVNPLITPTFSVPTAICNGATPPILPIISNNGITGTWNPAAVNNTTTTTYTFTPAAGQCAAVTTLTVTINNNTLPTFNAVGPICNGTTPPVLPATSINGITGAWNPSTVNNTTTTTYTFTPNAGQCATNNTLTITVNPNITPTFNAVGPICSGATAPVLPTTSTNGITGTWNPTAVSNTATTTYTFTPTAGQCATTKTLTVTVTPNVTPTFTAITPICNGATAPVLPTTSNNGITGTWNPTTVSNTGTATYTFTPTAGQCATTATLTVTVNPNLTPTFSVPTSICSGSTAPILPATSNNGITGTWNPATVSNTATSTHFFTPTAGQCATTGTLTITVNPNITPVFNAIAPICSGTTAPVLPTTSNNGITGTWNPATVSNTATATYTFTPTAGQCAPTVTSTVTVKNKVTNTVQKTICAPEVPYTWNGIPNAHTGTVYTTTAANGCDSIVTLQLTVMPPVVTVNFDTAACGSMTYRNVNYTHSTILHDTFTNTFGCDSFILISHLVIHSNIPYRKTIDTLGCYKVVYEGNTYVDNTQLIDTFRNVLGCDSIVRTVNITVDNFELNLSVTPPDPYKGEPIDLISSAANDDNYIITTWSPPMLFPKQTQKDYTILANEDETIIINGTDEHGCTDTASVTYTVKPLDYGVFIPNAFSPNGDGNNDKFAPIFYMKRAYIIKTFKVFNRWGQAVYSSSNSLNGAWDGNLSNGTLADIGNYNYYMIIRFVDGTERSFKGDVTLIR